MAQQPIPEDLSKHTDTKVSSHDAVMTLQITAFLRKVAKHGPNCREGAYKEINAEIQEFQVSLVTSHLNMLPPRYHSLLLVAVCI
jgi:hypothetical protein